MFNGGGNYELPTSIGSFFASTNIAYTTRYYGFSIDNSFFTPAYALVNATIGWKSSDEHWRTSLTARNLTNRQYGYGSPGFVPFSFQQAPGDPRTYELLVGFHW